MPYAMPGIIKKQTKVYTKGNILPHLGLVVILPRNLRHEGDLWIRGTGVPDEDAEDVEEVAAQPATR